MTYHTITAHCDRCGTSIALNPIQLVTHPLCIPAGHAWATFVRAHMRCGNTETAQVAPNAPTPAIVRPGVISAPQPLLPGGPEQAPHSLRVVGPNSGGQPSPMVTNHHQPIAAYAPPNIVTHAPNPSSAGPAGGQQSGVVKQTATIIMPDGTSYDATQGQPAPSSTPLGTPSTAQQAAPPHGHRMVGPYEWGPLEGAKLYEPSDGGVFTLNIDSTLMIERTDPPVVEAHTNGRPLQCGSDAKRYMLQFTPGTASLKSPGAKELSIVGRRLLKHNGQPWVDLPPPPPEAATKETPSTLLTSSRPAPEPAPPPPIPELETTLTRCQHVMAGTDGELCWLATGHAGNHERSSEPNQEWPAAADHERELQASRELPTAAPPSPAAPLEVSP